MLSLSFRQTQAEMLVRIASTLIFNQLVKAGCPLVTLRQLTNNPQYGYTASGSATAVGPKFVRITDLKDGYINWHTLMNINIPVIEDINLQREISNFINIVRIRQDGIKVDFPYLSYPLNNVSRLIAQIEMVVAHIAEVHCLHSDIERENRQLLL